MSARMVSEDDALNNTKAEPALALAEALCSAARPLTGTPIQRSDAIEPMIAPQLSNDNRWIEARRFDVSGGMAIEESTRYLNATDASYDLHASAISALDMSDRF